MTRQVAGDKGGSLSVVEKAQSAVNTLKIITALNEISDILKVGMHHEAVRSTCSC